MFVYLVTTSWAHATTLSVHSLVDYFFLKKDIETWNNHHRNYLASYVLSFLSTQVYVCVYDAITVILKPKICGHRVYVCADLKR